jgi:molecular chaperone DnaK
VEVTFDIDANGILKVSASDKATGRTQHITITASSGLSDSEVDKMVKDAEKFAAEDTKRKERIEVRNNADATVYTAEKTLRDLGDKVPADIRNEVEAKAAALKGILETGSVDDLKRKTENLGQSIQKIGASMYQQPGGTPPDMGGMGDMGNMGSSSGPTGPTSSGGEDVIDGEFTKN